MTLFLKESPGRLSIHNEDFCSVTITTFNRHAFLTRLIDSIHQYADMPFELIVSDDGGFFYDNLGFFQSIKDRVTRVSINFGKNVGLGVNANMGVGLTRSKYVFHFQDDSMVRGPFMRKYVELMKHTPYIGFVTLFSVGSDDDFNKSLSSGRIRCQTSYGQPYVITLDSAHSGGLGFTKAYWYRVGGFGEDDAYGDMPFYNKGFQQGFFNGSLINVGDAPVFDADKNPDGTTSNSSIPHRADKILCHYPKLFRVSDDIQRQWSASRNDACCLRNNDENHQMFSESTISGWRTYFLDCLKDGTINWNMLDKFGHSRFRSAIEANMWR